ncbi:glucose dehydrogenase [FAD, quinone]-like [Coccinella septempunctata]|uniref:glucose dehydrogenase [FAD, quinone]-like n=1 Tax=Coccinella septempunctata TaxID=41139 RepID=UPI001D061CE8|nr:glucose dehydrogenase [FAD, quinone]-like [Coccinella septempunctata]
MLPVYIIFFLCQVSGIDQDPRNLKIEYLSKLIDSELEKIKNYKVRIDNKDLLGSAENTRVLLEYGEFDFIIVGGGSAGSAIANRLSEIEEWKILLLEAGDVNDDFTDIPYFFEPALNSDRNWGYFTIPQRNACLGRINNQCPYAQGKILGGSGTMSGLVYSRGIKRDFDKWSSQGIPGWTWDDVLPYYKKIENYESQKIDLNYRGFGGPLNVAYVKPSNPIHQAIIDAHGQIGIKFLEDYNAKRISGISFTQHNTQRGRRVSGANNYVKTAWNRINFNVTLKAFATKILINDETKTAYGVEFVKNNKKYIARARKEVISSAGSINSPQLLMLSGIGPKSDLERLGIRVIQNLPVGRHTKDHIGFQNFYFKSNHVEPLLSTEQLVKQYLDGEGFYTAPTNYRLTSYYNSRNSSSPYPNIEVEFSFPKPLSTGYPGWSTFKKTISNFTDKVKQSSTFSLELFFLHPKSSGTLKLKSANPKDFPLIDSNIFDDAEDLEDIYRGVEVSLSLLDTPVGKSLNLTLELDIPECSREIYRSKKFWFCVLRHFVGPALHLSSSTKMGNSNDPLAVVNHELKVYGIKGLRVADVGVVPGTVTGHINAQAFLIGERAADMIKKQYLK